MRLLLKCRNKEIPVQFLVTKLSQLGSRAASGAAAQPLKLSGISLMPVFALLFWILFFFPLQNSSSGSDVFGGDF